MTVQDPHERGHPEDLTSIAREETARRYGLRGPHWQRRRLVAVAAALTRPGMYAGIQRDDETNALWQARAVLAVLDGLSNTIEVD